jgi:hypothetical protein
MFDETRLAHLSRICILRYDTTYLGSKYIYTSSFLLLNIHTSHKLPKAGQDTKSDAHMYQATFATDR